MIVFFHKLFDFIIPSAAAEATDRIKLAGDYTWLERLSPPEDISVNGHMVDYLFNYTTWMNVIFFAAVCLGIFGFSYLYRAKKSSKAYYTYGNKKAHILVATVIGLLVFLVIDLNITRLSNDDLLSTFFKYPKKDSDALKIEVMGQQWMWKFRYAGDDGVFNTDDDVVTMNDLRVPIGRKINFQITSKDVIHSFFLPNARRKVDAIPGKINRIWFEFKKSGKWPIVCAEMCGTHHYLMEAHMTTYSKESFNTWYNQAKKYAAVENDPEDANVFWGWKWQ